jgi:hypothetical protein
MAISSLPTYVWCFTLADNFIVVGLAGAVGLSKGYVNPGLASHLRASSNSSSNTVAAPGCALCKGLRSSCPADTSYISQHRKWLIAYWRDGGSVRAGKVQAGGSGDSTLCQRPAKVKPPCTAQFAADLQQPRPIPGIYAACCSLR